MADTCGCIFGEDFVLCSFSSLDDLKGKDRCNPLKILAALERAGRFSCFEVDDALADPLTRILNSDWVETKDDLGYPWTKVTLTDKGRAQLRPRLDKGGADGAR